MTSLAVVLLVGGLIIFGIVVSARYLDALVWRRSLLAFTLQLPAGLTGDDVARWLAGIAAATHAPRWALLAAPPIVLEVVADKTGITHMLLVPKSMRGTVLSGLRAALPGARVTEAPDYPAERTDYPMAAEATLTSHRRLMAIDRAEATATALLASLQPLANTERMVVQWIITGAGTPAPIISATARQKADVPWWLPHEDLSYGDAIRSARLKQGDVLLYASVRVGITASTAARRYDLFGRIWNPLRGLNSPGVQVVRRWWLWPAWVTRRLRQRATPLLSWPLLLGSHEAAGLLPLPIGKVALPGLSLGGARQLPSSPSLLAAGAQLGISNYPGSRQPLRLTAADRLRHLHVVGPTGVGKSTLLGNLILHDIAAGAGVVVIDPKGDLCDDVLARLPDQRAEDVIVLNPAITERPVGFNILQSAHDEQSRELVVDHVIHIWHELYKPFWGPRTEDVMRASLLTLINTRAANGAAFTLIEVPELLTNARFRRFVVNQPGVPAGLASFWQWYEATDRLAVIGPILNKLRASVLRAPIRLMLGQSAGLDLTQVLANRQILLVPLSKGVLGAETASLIGTLQLAALWQAILGRVRVPVAQRRPVFVYIDEAQDVLRLPVDMADMLAQARGLGASFTLAYQHLGQIDNKQIRSALLGTVCSQVVFQCQREDAVTLAQSFAPRLTADDLMDLDAYEIEVRPSVGGRRIAPVTGTTIPLADMVRDAQSLAAASRQQHGRTREDVEAELAVRIRPPDRTASSETGANTSTPFGRRRKADDDSGARP